MLTGHEGKTYYELLRVAPDAQSDEIKRSYREFAKIYHPDSNHFDDIIQTPLTERDLEIFRMLTDAYDTLIDPQRRAAYDQHLASGKGIDSDPFVSTPPSKAAPESTAAPEATRVPTTQKQRLVGLIMVFLGTIAPVVIVLGGILWWMFR